MLHSTYLEKDGIKKQNVNDDPVPFRCLSSLCVCMCNIRALEVAHVADNVINVISYTCAFSLNHIISQNFCHVKGHVLDVTANILSVIYIYVVYLNKKNVEILSLLIKCFNL